MLLREEPLPDPEPEQRADEIEELAIRRIVKERRAMVRTRGYYIVLAVACCVAALQALVLLAKDVLIGGWNPRLLIYPAGALAALILAWEMRKRVREVGEQMRSSRMRDPETPPDFTHLSDGSQSLRNLEDFGASGGPEPGAEPDSKPQKE